MDQTVLVIGREDCTTSAGPLAVGEMRRLPVVEAIQLTAANRVTLADFKDQQRTDLPETKRHYRRRDLRAEV